MATAGLTAALGAQGRAKANWLTDGYDKERTSWQRNETWLSPDTVGRMKLLWKVRLDNQPRQMHNLFPALIRDLHATILNLFGLNHDAFTFRHQGLDHKLVGVEVPAHVVKGLLA
jgi:hypothetical protein